ncbi:teichoic acid transport system permease protein [Lachnospiraceae bacterium NK3A20]|nr:teichoic acid transport system permease protein [Lachnospiraceae bacterium NK3A20]
MANQKRKKIILAIVWAIAAAALVIMLLHNNPLDDPHTQLIKKIWSCVLISGGVVMFTLLYDRVALLAADLYSNRRLIWRLSKNDFRKRYAGSYLGVVWSLVPPLVTVLMYYVVFGLIFKSGRQAISGTIDVPYVLYLTAGLVPWFFFSDALPGGTTSLLEYEYLVKKVVFKVSILPMIKVNAAVFTHIGFTAILLVVSMLYGYLPSVYWLQLVYYTACEYIFVLALVYATSAIVVFFRDLQQIIAILLQVGMWATPILWNISVISSRKRPLFKLNPMAYIVEGYRSSIYGREWFWSHFYSSTYFWVVTVLLFVIGAAIFKKLKPQFADVM